MRSRLALSLVLALAAGCSGSDGSVQAQARDTWDELSSLGADRIEEFTTRAGQELDELAAELEAGAEEVGADVADAADASGDAIETRIAEVRAELDELGDETAETWDEARDALVAELREIERMIEREAS